MPLHTTGRHGWCLCHTLKGNGEARGPCPRVQGGGVGQDGEGALISTCLELANEFAVKTFMCITGEPTPQTTFSDFIVQGQGLDVGVF